MDTMSFDLLGAHVELIEDIKKIKYDGYVADLGEDFNVVYDFLIENIVYDDKSNDYIVNGKAYKDFLSLLNKIAENNYELKKICISLL